MNNVEKQILYKSSQLLVSISGKANQMSTKDTQGYYNDIHVALKIFINITYALFDNDKKYAKELTNELSDYVSKIFKDNNLGYPNEDLFKHI